jgi:hypothetical protein
VNHATAIGWQVTHPEFSATVDEMLKNAPANEIYDFSASRDDGIE